MASKTTYELTTLKRELRSHGVVCRIRTYAGGLKTRIDIYWIPPKVVRALRPFTSSMPLALIKDIRGNGFAPLNDAPSAGLLDNGIFSASFQSDDKNGLELAHAVTAAHVPPRQRRTRHDSTA
jgi:hypothetical protein